ncbi:hypothetical protein [uncultured Winogradskyella sp.]|uniref:hypothetical protein n=1 Tax=uncultured Winogradskyella sp. TaxID=395353 RepID=UPI00262945BD|nr:hypothetical protein [uncultured Winogradskyella sp.]
MKLLKQLSTILLILLTASCVQQTQPKTIIVKLDMTEIKNHSKVGIRGNYPLSWDETTFLSDEDNNGIYEETFEIYTANSTIEFKFVNNDSEFELQDQNNRSITFDYKPETIIYEAVFNNPEEKITKN